MAHDNGYYKNFHWRSELKPDCKELRDKGEMRNVNNYLKDLVKKECRWRGSW